MTRAELDDLQARIEALREHGEDYLILSVGVRGPNYDCPDGNAVATVRMGNDEASAGALHLIDAIHLARQKILRERKARAAAKEREKAGDQLQATGAA